MSNRYQGGFITASYNGLKVPDAPTIGTATGANASASVTFTAPTNIGGGAITGFTVVSTPSGITGAGASSPITVSGLTNGTPYTFKVFATNAYGPSGLSASSNSVTPALAIGDAFGGGYFAGQISTAGNGIADYNLVVADATVGSVNGLQWKTTQTTTAGTSSVIDGPANSSAMNNASHPAAQFCEALNTGGYTDWYMPAKNELEVCYYFLKPGTTSNNTGFGSNANAVSPEPISTNYSAGSPAQTSATTFRTGASSQEFSTGDWWSSTENSSVFAAQQGFNTGYQSQDGKTAGNLNTRAIRRVAV